MLCGQVNHAIKMFFKSYLSSVIKSRKYDRTVHTCTEKRLDFNMNIHHVEKMPFKPDNKH